MRVITTLDLDNLLIEAKHSPRKRAILRLHEHEEPVQRMFNAVLPGTYVAPHKHERPDKTELMSLLKGRVAVMQMTPLGEVEQIVLLEERGLNQVVEIPPRTFHTLIALEPSVILEVIQGPYVAATHKQFAVWAPLEDNPKARDYLLYLESIVHNAL